MSTQEIFKKIYQDLKDEMSKNDTDIFLKEYTIPSINYNSNSENTEDMYFASGIEMELNKMMEFFNNEVYFYGYKDKYFFSNSQDKLNERIFMNLGGLTRKVEEEYQEFFKELKQKQPEEIIYQADEKMIKQEILKIIKSEEHSIFETKALLRRENILDEFYYKILDKYDEIDKVMRDLVKSEISVIVDNYKEEITKKNRGSR